MEMNQLDCDSHLPPRKRLLAGFKRLNGSSSPSPSPSAFASSSSASNSNGSSSSSASTNVQTHLDNLLASRYSINDQNQSPEELVEATRSAAALAVKTAKAARAIANEKALISAKAIAAAKRALELVESFPKEAMAAADCKERSLKKNKQKKHVPVDFLYSKAQLRRAEEEDLARRLDRAIDNRYHRVLRTCSAFEENGQRNKNKNKNVVEVGSSSMNDIAGVVDSDSSYEGLVLNRKASKAALEPDEADSTPGKDKAEEESNSLGKRRGRVKLKKLPLIVCSSKEQEIGSSSVAQQPESGVIPVKPGSSSWKCQNIKAPECVKQNKAVRS
uniref:Uncharacterized protein n=1 Tax=Noccaea caerulescens TaxID=107243 RepID=A0A1J3ITJ4_NOCCA